MTNTSGCPGSDRSGPTASRPPRVSAPSPSWSATIRASGLAVTPAPAGAPAVVVVDAVATPESFRGSSAANFTITLSAPATSAVTVAYTTADDSATAGADYTATSGTVTFLPGETVKTVPVPISGDTLSEGDETFSLNVAVVDGAEALVGDERGVVTVQNQLVQPVTFNSALRAAFTDAWGVQPVDIGVGGSIPFVAAFAERFPDAAILVTGVEDPDSRPHAPNESLHLAEFERVCVAETVLLERLGGMAR